MRQEFDFYETPDPLSDWLFDEHTIAGRCYEPCVGSGAIIRASGQSEWSPNRRHWLTADIDPRWPADFHADATLSTYPHPIDWVVTNPPFSCWHEIAEQSLGAARVGVALYLRLSALEPKKEKARGWWSKNPPTDIYVCPRFAHQRSKKTGEWATDSVTCAWVVWERKRHAQRIRFAPEPVLVALDSYTPIHRKRMDALMGERG